MGEPNVFVTEGDEVLVRAVVIDAHWADKRLYKVRFRKVRLPMQLETDVEMWVHDRNLRPPEQP
jgi:hypothetical protein